MDTSLSYTEENYLKGIYHLSEAGAQEVSTNSLADLMQTKPATVSDMIKRLSKKKLVSYEKYKGVNISSEGQQIAVEIVRKHRLWEVFLYEKLKFQWDEVHDIAEQLEHIKSPALVERLDEFLDHPSFDPHGDPIPDKEGNIEEVSTTPLTDLEVGSKGIFIGVGTDDQALLQYLDKLKLRLGARLTVVDKIAFDGSLEFTIDNGNKQFISNQIGKELLIKKIV